MSNASTNQDCIIPSEGVSFNENSVYLMAINQPENDSYNNRLIFRWIISEKPFDEELFSDVINYFINRHETFKFSYHQDLKTRKVYKKIESKPVSLTVSSHKLAFEESDRRFLNYCKELGKGILPMNQAPLLKVSVVFDVNNIAYTVFYIPHLVNDGFSMARIFYPEITYLYKQFLNVPKAERNFDSAGLQQPASFSDFVRYEREIFEKKLEVVKKFYQERYKPVDLTNKYIAMETEEKFVLGLFRVFDKTPEYNNLIESKGLTSAMLLFTIYQLSLTKVLKLNAIPITKVFSNRVEPFLNTYGFIAHENAIIEELKDNETLEELYNRNKETARMMAKTVGDVDGTVVTRLMGLPIPRFKFNYIPKEMSDAPGQDVILIPITEYYEGWNWDGELFKVKFGFAPYEYPKYIALTFYHQKGEFPREVAESIADTTQELIEVAHLLWKTPIGEIDMKSKPLLKNSKL